MLNLLPLALLAFAPMQEPAGEDESPWSGTADAGLLWLTGNNTSVTSNADITANYQQSGHRIILVGTYAGVRQETTLASGAKDSSSTARLYQFTGAYNRFLDDEENLYAYGNSLARQDKPNGLDSRYALGGGLGYTFRWGDSDAELSVEGGPAALKENNTRGTGPIVVGKLNGTAGDTAINGRVAARYQNPFAEGWTANANAEFYQSFDESTDRFATGDIGVRWNFDDTWYLKAGVAVAWDASPAQGFERTDYRYTLGVGTTF